MIEIEWIRFTPTDSARWLKCESDAKSKHYIGQMCVRFEFQLNWRNWNAKTSDTRNSISKNPPGPQGLWNEFLNRQIFCFSKFIKTTSMRIDCLRHKNAICFFLSRWCLPRHHHIKNGPKPKHPFEWIHKFPNGSFSSTKSMRLICAIQLEFARHAHTFTCSF